MIIINSSLARAIDKTRSKDKFMSLLAAANLIATYLNIAYRIHDIYQLIYCFELIGASYILLIIYENENKNMNNFEHVLNMGFLIKDLELENYDVPVAEPELEQMIEIKKKIDVPFYKVWYSLIKVTIHNFCFEQQDCFGFLFVWLIIIQGLIYQQFLSEIAKYQIGVMLLTLPEVINIVIGIFIEIPRRIKQYFKIKRLERRIRAYQALQEQATYLEEQERLGQIQNEQRQALLQQMDLENQKREMHNLIQQEQLVCVICSENLEEDQELQQLKCHPSHIFHKQCIETWFSSRVQNRIAPTCPICRVVINTATN